MPVHSGAQRGGLCDIYLVIGAGQKGIDKKERVSSAREESSGGLRRWWRGERRKEGAYINTACSYKLLGPADESVHSCS